ncbi:hypothetical protein [Streptomyces mirabilis]
MTIKQVMHRALAAVCVTLAITAVGAYPATADTRDGCTYPRVCFYKTEADWQARKPTAAYKDVTSTYQQLGPRSFGSVAILNSRNDDGALLHFADGDTVCLKPDYTLFPAYPGAPPVDAIRIMDSPTC